MANSAGIEKLKITPPEVAKRYGVSAETVLDWIRSGELRAINVARKSATRPRYRVDISDLDEFERGRQVAVTTRRRNRRKSQPAVHEYF